MLVPAVPVSSHRNAPTAVLLMRGGRIAAAMLEAELSKYGFTVPYATILIALLENGDRTATDLCMLTMRERANMSVLLSKLRRLEYVIENLNPLDARSHLVSLTPKGRDMAEKCKKITDDVSDVIDKFLTAHYEDPTRFRVTLSDLVGKFYSINT